MFQFKALAFLGCFLVFQVASADRWLHIMIKNLSDRVFLYSPVSIDKNPKRMISFGYKAIGLFELSLGGRKFYDDILLSTDEDGFKTMVFGRRVQRRVSSEFQETFELEIVRCDISEELELVRYDISEEAQVDNKKLVYLRRDANTPSCFAVANDQSGRLQLKPIAPEVCTGSVQVSQ